MVLFFEKKSNQVIALSSSNDLPVEDIKKLEWLFGEAKKSDSSSMQGFFIGLVKR